MPIRVAVSRIKIGHGEEQLVINPGEEHNFTSAQLRELEAHDPPVLRLPAEQRAAMAAAGRTQPDDEDEERQPRDEGEGDGKPAATGRGGRARRQPADDEL